MNYIRSASWGCVVLGCVFLGGVICCRAATAQALSDQVLTPEQRSAFLLPPPQEVLERGMQPLSSHLPDVSLRTGRRPVDVSQGVFDGRDTQYAAHRGDNWTPIQYQWFASELCHRPLYFEDAMLERHGQTRRPLVQPWASGTRFFLTFPVLPYAMVVEPPCRRQSALGYYRPGSAAPLLLQRPPFQANAGAVEASVWVGLIFLIP